MFSSCLHRLHLIMIFSLLQGFEVREGELFLMSKIIESSLGIQCCVLMGANVANDIANKQFAETTIGSTLCLISSHHLLLHLIVLFSDL